MKILEIIPELLGLISQERKTGVTSERCSLYCCLSRHRQQLTTLPLYCWLLLPIATDTISFLNYYTFLAVLVSYLQFRIFNTIILKIGLKAPRYTYLTTLFGWYFQFKNPSPVSSVLFSNRNKCWMCISTITSLIVDYIRTVIFRKLFKKKPIVLLLVICFIWTLL